jgi:PAS domain S-box-containing protein
LEVSVHLKINAQIDDEEKDRIQIVVDGIPFNIWVTGPDGSQRFVNRTYREFFGVGEQGALGDRWQELIHPEDLKPYTEKFFACLADRKPFHSELRVKRADGEWRWIESHGNPLFSKAGVFLGYIGTSPDITEHKRSYQAIQESEVRYRRLVETASEGIGQFDLEMRIIDVNERAASLLGYSRAEIIGHHLQEFTTPSEISNFRSKIENRKKGVSESYEACLVRKDGSNLWVLISASPLRDNQEKIIGTFVMFTDISERKRAEEELRRSEKRLSMAINLAGLCTWDIDLTTGVAIVSESHFEMFGYPKTRDRIMPFSLWESRVHPDDLPRVLQAMEDTRIKGSFYSPEYRIIRADNQEIRWMLEFGQCVNDELGIRHFMGVTLDITERKMAEQKLRESEERYRIVADNTYDWELWRSPDGHYNYCSPSCYRITGYTSHQFQSQPELIEKIIHPEDISIWRLHLQHLVNKQECSGIEFRIHRADGGMHWIGHACQPVFDTSGNYIGERASNRDITKQKLAEQQLNEYWGSLERMVQERTSELARTIETLQGEIEQRVLAEQELKLANEKLTERAEQLRRLTGELTMAEQAERKRLSRIMHDGLQPHLASVKLRTGFLRGQIGNTAHKIDLGQIEKLIGEALNMSRRLSAELSPSILYEGQLSDGLRWLARWMRDKYSFNIDLALQTVPELREDAKVLIFEAVRELLFNAFKHSGAASARVKLEPVEGGGLRVVVSDEGNGFDACLFKPLGEDSGLGLFSIRERISLIGGRLEIDSAPGMGSRLTLSVSDSQGAFVTFAADDVSARIDPS